MDLEPLRRHFAGHRPLLLIVLDGWGIGAHLEYDAIAQAATPVMDRLWAQYPHTTLMTCGFHVGLPGQRDLGGSEVGHLTMGAGRILDQGPTRIVKAIEDGSFFASEVLGEIIECGRGGHTVHLLGLLSDGNIHSHIAHFEVVIRHADRSGVARLRLHALLDGRDVGIQSALDYTARIEALFGKINAKGGRDYRIASGGGREQITMDRDTTWPKVAAGWACHALGESPNRFPSIAAAIRAFRAATPAIIDQDLPGFVIVDPAGRAVGPVADGDAVLCMNFRADRAVEISQAFELDDFSGFDRGRRPACLYAGMMVYDEDHNLPRKVVMGPARVERPLGERLVEWGLSQFRLAETQKYPHVTFFFNGGRHEPLAPARESYVLIESDKIDSFAHAPAMKAVEIAESAERLVAEGRFDFGILNFANTDMVGHTGDFAAAKVAATAVDTALGRVLAAVERAGGVALVLADHGNADEMVIINKRGAAEISTKHSLNPVPCICFDPQAERPYHLRQPEGEEVAGSTPGLGHVAATCCVMLGRPVPEGWLPPLFVE
ncbi:MAG: 2,3-bisphosphoglycerate-independent phosphoglycerate mutase [Nitrospirae bacterium CG_4_8_14_3_um_filter_70_85]|nr:MAG: 2,3-bisphosphoglycerate-independent phosphoglycerate mutase [Nitrospirae bacterium CG_4_8_14_3_um_filter_70_85]HBB41224.1 2,3-bisphosphoglycerate-independent phosphoglycerate mutase [Pseudomonadota bacterium]